MTDDTNNSYTPENHQAERRDLDYPRADLLPVIGVIRVISHDTSLSAWWNYKA